MVIMPGIGMLIAYTCYLFNIIDRCLALMMMILWASPTSLQLLMICTSYKSQVENISKLYLIIYATAAIPLTVWTIGFIVLLYEV